jgi:tRNA wybutosine-synthesizing protein 5
MLLTTRGHAGGASPARDGNTDGDIDDDNDNLTAGILSLCGLQMPAAATSTADRRSIDKAIAKSTRAAAVAAAARTAATTDGAPLPPAPPLRPGAPMLWPPPPPPLPPASSCGGRGVQRLPCPATREAFAAQVTSLGEPIVLTGVLMGDAQRLWANPAHFTHGPEAHKVVEVHVCSVQTPSLGERERESDGGGTGAADVRVGSGVGGNRGGGGEGTGKDRTVVVDLAGHRKPGTPRNFEFRKMPFAELIRRVSSHGTGNGVCAGLVPVVARGEKYYLRSVAHKSAAHLPADFPSLAADLHPGVILSTPTKGEEGREGSDGGYGGDARGGSDRGDGTQGILASTASPREGIGENGSARQTNNNDSSLWPADAYHSSVLRVASPGTALWTHYDTHDNLLAQIAGRKTVTLWAPGAEPFLYVEGSSSRVDDIDQKLSPYPVMEGTENEDGVGVGIGGAAGDGDAVGGNATGATLRGSGGRFPKFAAVSDRRWVATLGPGEALYIPALWFHHVLSDPLNSGDGDVGGGGGGSGMSIAVNVFWKCLPDGEHDPGDLFGNKDPPAARRASELAARAGAAIAHLPEPHRTFYARRAVQRLAAQLGMQLGGL